MSIFPEPSTTTSRNSFEEGEVVCYKHIQIFDTEIISSLLERIDQISIIKLEFCNLTDTQIEVLADLLVHNYSISEVSVNGNPNESQNFYLLLHKTHIIILSLKFCLIDSKGIEKISNELYNPYDGYLLHLNLCSNSIGTEGVKYVARFLRINRTLLSLNLADNKIYDPGCSQLMMPLQKFFLNFEESVIRTRMKFELVRKNVSISVGHTAKKDIRAKRASAAKVASTPYLQASSTNIKSRASSNSKQNPIHPFMEDHYENGNQEIYCSGNEVLTNLNLSYNRITQQGLNSILQMLSFQINYYEKGISRITTEGNNFRNCEQKLNKLKELLTMNAKRSSLGGTKRRSHINLRKRS